MSYALISSSLFSAKIIITGIFSLLSLEINLSIIAAILTIVGYSMNDTVVIYDRIRENLNKYNRLNISEIADLSINQVYTQQEINNILQKLNATNFFESVVLDINQDVLKILVEERPLIKNIYFEGNKSIKDNILKEIISVSNSNILSKRQIEIDAEKIANAYLNKGNIFAIWAPPKCTVLRRAAKNFFKIFGYRLVLSNHFNKLYLF